MERKAQAPSELDKMLLGDLATTPTVQPESLQKMVKPKNLLFWEMYWILAGTRVFSEGQPQSLTPSSAESVMSIYGLSDPWHRRHFMRCVVRMDRVHTQSINKKGATDGQT